MSRRRIVPALTPLLTPARLIRYALIATALILAAGFVSRVAAQSSPQSTPQNAPQTTSASSTAASAATVSSATPPPTASPAQTPRPARVATTAPRPLRGPEVPADALSAYVDAVIPALMQRDHVLGVTVAIVQGSEPLVVKGYGFDRLDPARRVDPYASLFRLGSMTKTFTWIAARQEIEAGRMKLDAPISSYLSPDVFPEDRRYKPIQVRNLMDHTPGYEDTALGHLFQPDFSTFVGMDSYLRKYKPRRVREPGLYSSYSNYGAELVARAARQTAQAKDVPSLMEMRIFRPLGLDHTTLREPYEPSPGQDSDLPAPLDATLQRNLSSGFVWDGAGYSPQPFDHAMALSGALGGSSTASDMARYMALLLGDGQLDGVTLYGPETARAFRTPMLNVPEGFNGWASGFMMRNAPSGYRTFGHTGSTLWFSSNMVLIPELDIGIFIAANTQTGESLTETFPDLVLAHLKNVSPAPPAAPAAQSAFDANAATLKPLRGDYVSTRRAYDGLEGAITRLINTVQISFAEDGRLILSANNGVTAYLPTARKGIYTPQTPEDTGPALGLGALHFIPKPDGKGAIAFETASNTARFERASWIHKPSTLSFMTTLVILTCVFSLIGMGRNHHNLNRPTQSQVGATWITYAISLCWVLSILIFANWRGHVVNDPMGLFTSWPNAEVQLASFLAFLASIGTLYQLASLFTVFRPAMHYLDGWADWQKIAHVALNLVWLTYVITLAAWGALSFWGRL